MAQFRKLNATQPTPNFAPSRLALKIALHCTGLWLMALPLVGQAESVSVAQARQLDWVPIEELTEEQKKTVPIACCGAYIAPERTDPEANIDPDEASLIGSALSSESDMLSTVIMRDDVKLTQGTRSISTDLFTLNKETSEAELKGDIQLREPGMLVRADKAYINMQSGDARLDDARFVLYETRVHGEAKSLEKFGDKILVLNQGSISGCEPGDNTWAIEGANITIHNDKHYGTATHMRMKVRDIPVAYFPYVRFPVGPDRLTGFLFPSVGLGNSGLSEFSLPFYWNIAPNMDATITPRYLEEHGYMLGLEVRHMSALFDTTLDASALNNDRNGISRRLEKELEAGTITEEEAYPYKGKDRWQASLRQKGGRNQRWHTEINYTDVSDTDYIRDIDRSAVDLNREAYIRKKLLASYITDNWMLSAKAEELRLLTETQLPYRELPRVNANGQYRFGDWLLDMRNEYVDFALNSNYDSLANPINELILGKRMRTDYSFGWDKEFTSGFFKPRIGFKTLSYDLQAPDMLADADHSPSFVTAQSSLDTGLYFERDNSLFEHAFTQTLEPRVYYLHRKLDDQSSLFNLTPGGKYVNFDTSILPLTYQQLFRDTRFAGGDRLDDTEQVTFGLTSRFIDSANGIERLRLGIGQITYLKDRQVVLTDKQDELDSNENTSSMLATLIGGQVGAYFRFTNDIVYDQNEHNLYSISSSIHYMDDQYRIVNLGYRFSRDRQSLSPINPVPVTGQDLNQMDFSTIWPLANQWSAIARVNYDFNYDAELDALLGLEYDDCCYRIRMVARRWVNYNLSSDQLTALTGEDYDRGIFFELQLKGVGTLSQRISGWLDKAIIGFDSREQAKH